MCVCVCVNKIAEKTPQKNTLKAIFLSVPAQPKLMQQQQAGHNLKSVNHKLSDHQLNH
jgi:hypothetical protein